MCMRLKNCDKGEVHRAFPQFCAEYIYISVFNFFSSALSGQTAGLFKVNKNADIKFSAHNAFMV